MLISDAAQVPCELESLSILVLASHSLAMYDVIMTNIEYSYKPGRFYIAVFNRALGHCGFYLCFYCVFFKFLLPCYFLQEQPAQNVDSEANYALAAKHFAKWS